MSFDPSTFEVMSKNCQKCLFTPERLVSSKRMAQLLEDCQANRKHFVCHESGLQGGNACCRGFWDTYPGHTPAMRMAIYLDLVTLVEPAEPVI